MRITYKSIEYQLKDGCKTAYEVTEEKPWKRISKQCYHNITSDDTQKAFRRAGGSEYATRGYTSQGYLVVELVSKSPDKEIKHVRKFRFFS